MKSIPTKPPFLSSIVFIGCAPFAMAQPAADAKRSASEAAIELSPFLVQENSDQGYYASQTLAGGRLNQDLKDLGTSIQVVTKEMLRAEVVYVAELPAAPR